MDNKELYNKLIELNNKLLDIKEQEKNIKHEIDKVSKMCKHDYVLKYDMGKEFFGVDITKYCCLVCGKKFSIKDTDHIIIDNNICVIDIVTEARDFNILDIFLIDRNEEKIKKAKEIINKYFSEDYNKYDDKTLKYFIKKDILDSFGIKRQVKIKIKKRNDENE